MRVSAWGSILNFNVTGYQIRVLPALGNQRSRRHFVVLPQSGERKYKVETLLLTVSSRKRRDTTRKKSLTPMDVLEECSEQIVNEGKSYNSSFKGRSASIDHLAEDTVATDTTTLDQSIPASEDASMTFHPVPRPELQHRSPSARAMSITSPGRFGFDA